MWPLVRTWQVLLVSCEAWRSNKRLNTPSQTIQSHTGVASRILAKVIGNRFYVYLGPSRVLAGVS